MKDFMLKLILPFLPCAAGAWNVNQYGKLKIGKGTINLSTVAFRLALYTSAASANIAGDISLMVSVGSEVAQTGGYTTGGERLSSNTWALSGANGKFDSSDWVVTGSIQNIKYAYIVYSITATSGHLLCYSTLSANQFDLTGTNTMTIQMNTAGIFTLA
jgi:hypothetical protein